ncbi:unnamed protein product [Phytophthora fragariaefolia]|uniref:Unnamed protein product n=1 Tax=Phytophthora fragariaefolia TaxID=1490495 RepID=A0A9W6Y8H0_9STRA|nr:unnamed protein product [Phytophthora fragariaefolia]
MCSRTTQLAILMAMIWAKECAGAVDDVTTFYGSVGLYSGTNYRNKLITINFNTPNRCFNINCTRIDNRVQSANWDGLPTTGWAGKAFITFYADYGCDGKRTSALLPHNGGIREFVYPKGISSFMVRSESSFMRHGYADVCSWTGANAIGGYVVETDNDSR